MMLERCYRLLLHAYPSSVRTNRSDVELATLLDVSTPGQRLPRVREARAILREGVRERMFAQAGESSDEILASGGSLGVVFSISIQMWALGLVAVKASYGTHRGHIPLLLWALTIGVIAVIWSRLQQRWVIGAWQLVNVIGAAWFHRYMTSVPGTMLRVVILMVVMEALAASVALFFAERMPKRSRTPLPLGVTSIALALPLLGTLVMPFSAGPVFCVMGGVLALLVVSLVDPRPLVAIGAAVLTPVTSGLCASYAFNTGRGVRPVLFAALLLGVTVITLRSRVLLHRLGAR